MDELMRIEARLEYLNRQIELEKRKINEQFSHEEVSSLTPGERKKLRENAQWAEMRANQGYRAELLQVLDELSMLYLGATPTEHRYIRNIVANKREVLQALNSYIYRAVDRFQASKDPKWLYQGLASVAIEDLRFDYRDTVVALGDLFLAAADAGIDPLPYLREVAAISNSDVGYAGMSTQDLLHGYNQTAYFEEAVRRKLKR